MKRFDYTPEVSSLYHQGRLIPFIGAGASMSVSWVDGGVTKRGPSWGELVDQAAKMIGFSDPDLLRVRGTDLQILEYYRIKNGGHLTPLTNWLFAEMRPPDSALQNSRIHNALSALNKCSVFYTTNFDDFIERNFQLNGRPVHAVVNESHVKGIDHLGTSDVVKFHGDFNNPSEMVISERDYERRLSLKSMLDHRLRSDVLGHALLFIGYSFRDWNISYLFRLVQDEFHDLPNSILGRRAYILFPEPSEFEYQLFRERNIQVIPVSVAHRTDDIADWLDTIRS